VTATIQTLLLLIAVLVVVAVVARRFNTAPSILLVVAGIALALIPGLPRIGLAPELVLLGILPPLIYSAGVAMSWREFRFNLRPITLLAVGCVVFTTCAVAAVAHWLLGMPLAVGFVLGAIVSPPDVVAPLSIIRRLGVPRRLVVVLEGEGLANDATALILYRFAVAAVGSGVFSLTQAAGEFALIVIGEIAYGIGLGWLSLRLRRWARDPRVEITLSLLTPYAAFFALTKLGRSASCRACRSRPNRNRTTDPRFPHCPPARPRMSALDSFVARQHRFRCFLVTMSFSGQTKKFDFGTPA
jgi:NhaP-type Na+/H+ or K+/H+ antiporter